MLCLCIHFFKVPDYVIASCQNADSSFTNGLKVNVYGISFIFEH
jgi:hypothetical protein